MRLLREYLKRELPAIHKNNIRLLIIGRSEQLPEGVRKDIEAGMRLTAKNTGMKLVVALNYGGRAELVDAFNAMLDQVRSNGMSAFRADEQTISEHLYTAGLPDPDLLIRTSGEMRVSNFLLWQIAYAEMYVTETLWRIFPRPPARSAHRFSKTRTPLRRPRRHPRTGQGSGRRDEQIHSHLRPELTPNAPAYRHCLQSWFPL